MSSIPLDFITVMNANFILIPTFTLLTVLGAWIEIPLGPVPFIMSDFVVLLSGLALGPWRACLSIGIYLMLGALGLPVFADGGGILYFWGNTGGFLVGFLLAAAVVGMISHHGQHRFYKDALATICGQITFFAFGMAWFKVSANVSWMYTVENILMVFLVPIAIKFVTATTCGYFIRKKLGF